MSFGTTPPRLDYVGTGLVDTYGFNWRIWDPAEDLLVTQRDATSDVETTLVYLTDFTVPVNDINNFNGGNITLVAGDLPSGDALSIRFGGDAQQDSDIRNQGGLFLESIEDALDKVARYTQSNQEVVERSLRSGETETGVSMVLPYDRASRYLAFDANKEPIAIEADSASGTSVLATGSVTTRLLATRFSDWRNVLDYGLTNNDVDCTTAAQGLDAYGGSIMWWWPQGTYRITGAVLFSGQRVRLVGDGANNTIINFIPTTTNVACFTFNAVNPPYNIQVFCGIEGMKITGSGSSQAGKVAVKIVTNEEFWMSHFRIDGFTTISGAVGGLQDCVGIQHFGWQLNTFENGHVYADIPLDIRLNPWDLTVFLDLDGCNFRNLILACISQEAPSPVFPAIRANVQIEDGAFVTNSTFENVFLVGGTNGVEWIDLPRTITGVADNGSGKCRVTTSSAHNFLAGRTVEIRSVVGTHEVNVRAAATYVDSTHFDMETVTFVHAWTSGGVAYRSPGNSYMLTFDNCRCEQRDDTTKWSYYFDRKGSPVDSIEWRSCYPDATANGMYLRRVRRVSMQNVVIGATSKVSIDSVAEPQCAISLDNCMFSTSGATGKLVGYKQLWGGSKPASAQNIQASGLWASETQDATSQMLLDGTGHRSFRLTLVDDEVFNLQCGSGTGATAAIIQFFAFNGATIAMGTAFVDTATNVYNTDLPANVGTLCSTSVNVRLSDVDTFFCIYRNSSNIQIRNRLGVTVTVLVTIDERASQDITATQLSTTETYTVGAAQNFTDIVITDAVSAYVIASVKLLSAQSGTLNTATAGATTSIYDQGIATGQGIWLAEGTVANVNTLLAGLIWTPHPDVAITNCANDGSGFVRVTAPGHGYTSNQTFTIINVLGTVEANVSKTAMTYINANTFDIDTVAFVNAYISGGSLRYAGTTALHVQVVNAKQQVVQGRKALGPV